MEGVGARLGRSSTRYGPATVFSGPVRKWKKRWVHVTPPSSSSNHINNHSHHHNGTSNGTAAANNSNSSNGNNGSHLLLYKWTPLSQSNGSSSPATNNNGNSGNDDNKNNANLSNGDAPDEPPRRKFKYIPSQVEVDLLEKQKKEAEEQEALEKVDDESKLNDTDPIAELVSRSDSAEEKPDINDIPMEENEDDNQVVRQDLNESTLDLSLGLVS
ncbi:hypothetical protein SADUNF_Sadunf11G0010200 [Salix dunnii]|uniref:Uncharacterized protein n=1 Tax=Salix dunnii TaxID=1413687 RepID=A0A835JSE5_9ROSI|nr:hypothetical protein SADUNF_Sadunf11G0010200 [Salix dunnii]